MEDIDGGLHPAVDGQSLDEDKVYFCPTQFLELVHVAFFYPGIFWCLETVTVVVCAVYWLLGWSVLFEISRDSVHSDNQANAESGGSNW